MADEDLIVAERDEELLVVGTLAASKSMTELSPRLRAQFDVMFEREEQEAEFGTADDDLLTPPEWIARLAKHLGRAVSEDPGVYRRELVVIGALVLAGIEAFDRKISHGR